MHLLYSLVCRARWAAKVSSFVLAIAIPGAADKNKLADLIAFPVEDWSARRKASSKQSVSRTNPISWQGMTYFSHRLCARMFPGEASEAE